MREMFEVVQRQVQNHYDGTYGRIWVQWTRLSKGRGEYSLLITVFPNGVDESYRIIRGGTLVNPTEESTFTHALELIDGVFI